MKRKLTEAFLRDKARSSPLTVDRGRPLKTSCHRPLTTARARGWQKTRIGTVEVCHRGMWLIQVGEMTLRMAPCVVSELLLLLAKAVAEHAARYFADPDPFGAAPMGRPPRGSA